MIALALMPALVSGGWLLVSNEASNDVAIVDEAGGDVLAKIPIGQRPRGIRVAPGGKLALVAVSGSPRGGPGVDESKLPPPDRSQDGVAVIDLVTRTLTRVVKSGPDPETFDLTLDGKQLVIANEDAATASFVDLSSGAIVATVKVGEEPEGVAIHPSGRVVYVTSEAAGEVDVLDVKSHRVVAKVKTGARPRGVAFTADGRKAYVTNELGGTVTVVDAVKHKALREVVIPGKLARPMGVVVSPDQSMVWVTTGRGGSVVGLDAKSDRVLKVIEDVGARPWGIAISADGKTLYAANGPSGNVAAIDAAQGRVLRRVGTGNGPWGVARVEPPKRQLRVCSDPNNMPFSDERGEGFENKLAELLASELHADLEYTWWPQRRGFLRNTLKANRCDLVMGVPQGLDAVATTRPYYRSGYVFALGPKAAGVSSVASRQLESLKIGVPLMGDDGASPPPVFALAQRGLVSNLVGYAVQGDYRTQSPPAELIRAVSRGDIDLAVAWGPLAGYYAARATPKLQVVPLPAADALPGQPFVFDIALGVRKGDRALADELDGVLEKKAQQVAAILDQYDVPRL